MRKGRKWVCQKCGSKIVIDSDVYWSDDEKFHYCMDCWESIMKKYPKKCKELGIEINEEEE